jgi:hypothetical protein
MSTIFDRCIAIQCKRLAALPNPSAEDLKTFLASDIPGSQQLEEYLVRRLMRQCPCLRIGKFSTHFV